MNDMDALREQLLEWERAKYRLALGRAHDAAPGDALFDAPDARADLMAARATEELLPILVEVRDEWERDGPLAKDEVLRAREVRSERDLARSREAALFQAAKAKAPASALAVLRTAG